MWDRQIVFLAGIFSTAFFYKVTAGNGKLLNMASDVVDDLYSGCRQQAMEKFIDSGLLQQELNHSVGFQKAWNSNPQCKTLIPGGKQVHTAALSAYHNGDADFLKTLNNEVETMGANESTYENHFNFKSLHFLLMDSMTLLRPKSCQNVFVLQEKANIPQKGSTVRFGSFTVGTSSFEELKKLEDLDELVVLNITSCFFINVGGHICSQDKYAVLLSPAEDFTLENVYTKTEDDAEYTEVVLKHSNLNSTHNCFIFSRSPPGITTLWPVSALLAISFLF